MLSFLRLPEFPGKLSTSRAPAVIFDTHPSHPILFDGKLIDLCFGIVILSGLWLTVGVWQVGVVNRVHQPLFGRLFLIRDAELVFDPLWPDDGRPQQGVKASSEGASAGNAQG